MAEPAQQIMEQVPTAQPNQTVAQPAATPTPASQNASTIETPKPTWPDNWRQELAGNDDKLLSRAGRYATPKDVFNALIAAQNRISSGELRSQLPKDATPEQVNAWRKENGIPETPDKYDLSGLKDGLVIGEDDKPIIDSFTKIAHERNMPTEHVKAAVEWYYDEIERQHEATAMRDRETRTQTEDALRVEWGADFRPNVNRILGLLDTAPDGLKDKMLGVRMADGTPLFNDPDALRYFANLATQINPVTTLVPGAGANVADAISDEITNLETLMRDRTSAYWKGNTAEKNQARLRDLYAARERMNVRTA